MTKQDLITKLNADLANEYTHMHFYLHHSVMVKGINRAEISEWLLDHAKGEFDHIQQFAKLIVGLGGTPIHHHHPFPDFTNPDSIFRYAYDLEAQVVRNYAHRMEELDGVVGDNSCGNVTKEDKKYVTLFFEDQLLDSRGDLDEISQFIFKEN